MVFDTSGWNRVINISREQEINQKKELFNVTGEGYFQEEISHIYGRAIDAYQKEVFSVIEKGHPCVVEFTNSEYKKYKKRPDIPGRKQLSSVCGIRGPRKLDSLCNS